MESIVTQKINKIRDEEQRKALNAWAHQGFVGSVIAGTGFGKSRVGVLAVEHALKNGGNALILVPTVQLQEQFIEEFVKPQFEYDEIIYQKIPTFRVHQVDNLGVGEWHRDRDYNHGVDEINLWLPFTDAYGTNTIWMKSEEGKEDFKGYDVSYGEILVFSGPNLLHGNQTNIEKDSRCSIDFRIVHPDKFKTSDKGSVTANVKFKVGGYFEKL